MQISHDTNVEADQSLFTLLTSSQIDYPIT